MKRYKIESLDGLTTYIECNISDLFRNVAIYDEKPLLPAGVREESESESPKQNADIEQPLMPPNN